MDTTTKRTRAPWKTVAELKEELLAVSMTHTAAMERTQRLAANKAALSHLVELCSRTLGVEVASKISTVANGVEVSVMVNGLPRRGAGKTLADATQALLNACGVDAKVAS